MLKLKADEDAAAAAAAAATTTATRRPAATTTTNTNSTAPNSNNKAANGTGFQRGGATNAFRRDRDEKNAPKSSSINEAGGMWAKETLPPLAKNSKAEALKSDA